MKEIIIFLDIDGVIATNNSFDNLWKEYMGDTLTTNFNEILKKKNLPFINTSMKYWPFDKNCISNIHKLQLCFHEEGYVVNYVISSLWRIGRTVEELKNLFNIKGLYLTNIIGKTEQLKFSGGPRGNEILQWLKDNKKENSIYIVIDDDIDFDIIQYINKEHCLKTNFKDGFNNKLLKESINKIKKLL